MLSTRMIQAASGRGASIVFHEGRYTDVTSTTNDFTGVSFGVAAVGRIIAVIVHYKEQPDGDSISSVSIGGVSATQAVDRQSTYNSQLEIWYAVVPSGTSGTVSVVMTGATSRMTVGIWSIFGASSVTPIRTASQIKNSGQAPSVLTLALGTAEVGICGISMETSGTDATFANATKEYEYDDLGGSQNFQATGATLFSSDPEFLTHGNCYQAAAVWA